LGDYPFQVAYADPIRSPSAIENGKPRQFDVALASPPLGLRYTPDVVERDWFNRFPERTASGTVLSVRHLLAQASRRVVIAVTNNVLFSSGAELAMRQDLIKRGIVKAVVALPSGLLENTNIPFAVLVLDPAGGHQQVRFINADCPQFREPTSKAKARLINLEHLIQQALNGEPSEDVAIVPVADILANDSQLQVSRYVLPDTTKQLQALLAKSKTVALGDIVTTIRPLPPASGDTDSVDAFEVGAADLPSHGYIGAPGRTIKVPIKNEQQFLKPLDIVLIVKGSVGKLGIVPADAPPPGEGGWVAGQSAMVLRAAPGAQIDPRALALQLRSPLGQELIGGIVSGATIQLIQLKELMRLQVLVPDLETAHRAADALEQEAQLQREIDRLRQEQTQATAGLWTLD
jgi:type I restriction enzyme M protein